MRSKINIFLLLTILFFVSCDLDQSDTSWSKHFHKLIKDVKNLPMKKIAVAAAEDDFVLEAIKIAKEEGLAESILVGDEKKIREIAKTINMDLSKFEVINEPEPASAAKVAVKLVHDGICDVYVKGSLATRDVLKAVLDNEIGLRTNELISLVGVFEINNKLVFITDPSVIPYPTLLNKVELINNAVKFAKSTGVEMPKVAAVTAIDIANPRMPETLEAEELMEMNKRGEIKNCIVDGPLSLDLAMSPESAKIKNSNRRINGDADIILFPEVHSANIAYKILTYFSDAKSGNIIIGTRQPVILSSRSDSVETKLNSIILGFTYEIFKAQAQSKKP